MDFLKQSNLWSSYERVENTMSKKGENIYKRNDGRWEGRYKSGFDKNGKTKYKSVYSKTYGECKQKLLLAKNMQLKQTSNVKLYLTVKEMISSWIENIYIRVKQSTMNTYTNMINNHILPIMAQMPIHMITTEFLNQYVIEKIKNGRVDGKGGLSTKTVQNIVSILKSAFKYAEKIYGIDNPAALLALPKINKKEIEILTNKEIKMIQNDCSDKNDYFSLLFDLCLFTGIRIGEVCALQCSDIDFDNGILKIQKTVQRIKNETGQQKTKVIIDIPKTQSSIRKIPLPSTILSKLQKFIVAHEKKNDDFLFSSDNKKPIDVRTVQKRFSSVLYHCHIRKVKFHIIRHTFATKWVNANFDIKSLSEILGHSNVNITLSLYVHPSIETKRKQINELYIY